MPPEQATSSDGAFEVHAGQALIAHAGERIQYRTPAEDGAEYLAIYLPAFSPQTVNRSEVHAPSRAA
jgi:hypothetical protein